MSNPLGIMSGISLVQRVETALYIRVNSTFNVVLWFLASLTIGMTLEYLPIFIFESISDLPPQTAMQLHAPVLSGFVYIYIYNIYWIEISINIIQITYSWTNIGNTLRCISRVGWVLTSLSPLSLEKHWPINYQMYKVGCKSICS